MKVIISILILFFSSGLYAADPPKKTSYTARQNLKKVRRTVDKQIQKNHREQVQARRARIQYNGNINNFYPRAFKVEWIIINNRAHLMFRHYHSYYGYYNKYMRVS